MKEYRESISSILIITLQKHLESQDDPANQPLGSQGHGVQWGNPLYPGEHLSHFKPVYPSRHIQPPAGC